MFEIRVRCLIASFSARLAHEVIEGPASTLDAGEWGLAFDELCDMIYEGEIPVFPGELAEIESLGHQYHVKRRAWRLIKELLIDTEGNGS